MTERERFIKALKREPLTGHVPTFELVFYLTMESIKKVHPSQRTFGQWNQMSALVIADKVQYCQALLAFRLA